MVADTAHFITADCKEVADMYSPQIWPAGVYVRSYFEPRGHRVSPGNNPVGRNELLHSETNEAGATASYTVMRVVTYNCISV